VPEATLPAWVQARLAAERRRQEELAALEAPRVQLRPPPPPPTRPSSGSLADDAALHDPRTRAQRLREILDAPMQGIGAGIGTIHDPTPPRPASAPQEAPRTSEAERRRQEQRVWDVAFGPRELTREEERTWDVAFADRPRSSPGVLDHIAERQLWDEAREFEEAAGDALNVDWELASTARRVLAPYLAAHGKDAQLSSLTPRAFSDAGVNGLTAEERFDILMRDALGYSPSQVDRLLAGDSPLDVGIPTGRFVDRMPTDGDLDAASRLLRADETYQVVSDELLFDFARCFGQSAAWSLRTGGISPERAVAALALCGARQIYDPVPDPIDFFNHEAAQESPALGTQVPLNRIHESTAFGDGGFLDPHTEHGRWALEAFYGTGTDGLTPDERLIQALRLRGLSGDQIARVIEENRHAAAGGVPLQRFGPGPTLWDLQEASRLLTPPGMDPVDSEEILALITDPRIRARAEQEFAAAQGAGR
jgi:hypothetical protein